MSRCGGTGGKARAGTHGQQLLPSPRWRELPGELDLGSERGRRAQGGAAPPPPFSGNLGYEGMIRGDLPWPQNASQTLRLTLLPG